MFYARKVVRELGLRDSAIASMSTLAISELKRKIALKTVLQLLENADRWLRASLLAAKRSDGLMNSYNLLDYSADRSSMSVGELNEMLEGQVSGLKRRSSKQRRSSRANRYNV